MTRRELLARLAELDAAIEAYPTWGAGISPLTEERAAILRELKNYQVPDDE
jgi:hypothetical protein